jgi:ATP-dependent Clp protease ATP-binding subunit ClpB
MSATWRANLADAVLLDPLLLLHGNVKDVYTVDEATRGRLPPELRDRPTVSFDIWLSLEMERLGFDVVCLYDTDGIVVLRRSMLQPLRELMTGRPPSAAPATSAASVNAVTAATPALGDWLVPLEVQQAPADFVRTLATTVLPRTEVRCAVICRFVDRYLAYTDRQDPNDRMLSLLVQKAALGIPAMGSGGCTASRLLLIFDIEGQIPQELNTLFPSARSVFVNPPGLEERADFFRQFAGMFDSGGEPPANLAANASHCTFLAQLADGLRMQDLFSLATLSRQEHLGLSAAQFPLLLTRFKFGTRENAWAKIDPARLRNAKQVLARRVKGQDDVLDEVVPVLIRAKLGLSDLAGSVHSSKPRGAFFFVGPTGVGKTELSKAIAELVFGDEASLLRFDMSEYSEEHQQARLIGAPPGYVGFDQGGQLTNAIQQKPFSVVLFDEIEKAHGRILDKFLQILDDGRLTDGMGKTVYFSEAIIIFTSNLGTAPPPQRGVPGTAQTSVPGVAAATTDDVYTRLAELPYNKLSTHFRGAVRNFFVNSLGRPEILNRIGEDNILVFRFLNSGEAKSQIIEQQIENMRRSLRERHPVDMHCTTSFKRLLMAHPGGFDRNGARGVRNLLNRFVLNRLAADLFMEPDRCRGRVLRVDYEAAEDAIDGAAFDNSLLRYEWIDR